MKNILIIDDDRDILYALGEILSYKNWASLPAASVEEGLELFSTGPVDLIIIDYHMPGINGKEGIKKFRALSPAVPIIVLTVDENQKTADDCLDAGASDFAQKPIKAPDLLSRIAAHLKMGEAVSPPAKAYQSYTKGISQNTLSMIEECMKKSGGKMTMDRIGSETGLAYQTVHRYLNHLEQHGVVSVFENYGNIGRPKKYYSWIK